MNAILERVRTRDLDPMRKVYVDEYLTLCGRLHAEERLNGVELAAPPTLGGYIELRENKNWGQWAKHKWGMKLRHVWTPDREKGGDANSDQ